MVVNGKPSISSLYQKSAFILAVTLTFDLLNSKYNHLFFVPTATKW